MEDYDQVYKFLSTGDYNYPMDFTKNDERVLRRKCKKSFKVHSKPRQH